MFSQSKEIKWGGGGSGGSRKQDPDTGKSKGNPQDDSRAKTIVLRCMVVPRADRSPERRRLHEHKELERAPVCNQVKRGWWVLWMN
jgi:hypothetical protein